ncbi:MAG: 6-phosphogluconolactonase [Candidatus Omnitrophica bacterium]|nr:6-phosphogluconolactonase [Candidatus Omnitrophota bacterium]
MHKQEILVFRSPEEIAKAVIRKWMKIATEAIKEKGFFAVALSGKETALFLYERLGNLPDALPWDKTHIFFVDEQFIPDEHMHSNYNIVNEKIFSKVPIKKENIHAYDKTSATAMEAAKYYIRELERFFRLRRNEFPVFDLILLGIAEGGNTASLLSGSRMLEEKESMVCVSKSALLKYEHLTMTLPVINNARQIIFLVSGSKKAVVLKKVIKDKVFLPATLVAPEKGKLAFYIDKEAAEYL